MVLRLKFIIGHRFTRHGELSVGLHGLNRGLNDLVRGVAATIPFKRLCCASPSKPASLLPTLLRQRSVGRVASRPPRKHFRLDEPLPDDELESSRGHMIPPHQESGLGVDTQPRSASSSKS